ncbi:hypothetical protein [Paenibacillus sp. SAFN-117]|uniref:hypothetical protein n=1 Tax=Paenibacillus sp. SAFN-117 TaxID=3436860 RepID=UPI0012481D17|nr:hypothetical protein [Aneurinibacillus sp. XH2]
MEKSLRKYINFGLQSPDPPLELEKRCIFSGIAADYGQNGQKHAQLQAFCPPLRFRCVNMASTYIFTGIKPNFRLIFAGRRETPVLSIATWVK